MYIQESYDDGITDEFIKPIIAVDNSNNPIATIAEDDVIIFFNFRTDRGRQLTQALSQQDFPEYSMKKLSLHYVTMTNYDVETTFATMGLTRGKWYWEVKGGWKTSNRGLGINKASDMNVGFSEVTLKVVIHFHKMVIKILKFQAHKLQLK